MDMYILIYALIAFSQIGFGAGALVCDSGSFDTVCYISAVPTGMGANVSASGTGVLVLEFSGSFIVDDTISLAFASVIVNDTATMSASTIIVAAVDSVLVAGRLSADMRGHGAGAGPGAGTVGVGMSGTGGGHAGTGGQAVSEELREPVPSGQGQPYGGAPWDDPAPFALGSGGGGIGGHEDQGGAGGGRVRIDVTHGDAVVEGFVSADGGAGHAVGESIGTGGGSGGSVVISCAALRGGGTVRASGGNGENRSRPGGGGGGGFVSVRATSGVVTPGLVAHGGVSHRGYNTAFGGGGVVRVTTTGAWDAAIVYILNGYCWQCAAPTPIPAAPAAEVYVDEGGAASAPYPVYVPMVTIADEGLFVGDRLELAEPNGTILVSGLASNAAEVTLVAAKGGTVDVRAGASVAAPRVAILAATVTVAGSLDATGKGHTGGAGPGAGHEVGDGGSHGGHGGCGNGASTCGQSSHGDPTWPVDFGGSGVAYDAVFYDLGGSEGGGSIQVVASGHCHFAGGAAVTADGSSGFYYGAPILPGGGAGGSVAVACATMSAGAGATMSACGGRGDASTPHPPGGDGGGGRVAVYTGDGVIPPALVLSAVGGAGGPLDRPNATRAAAGTVVTGLALICSAAPGPPTVNATSVRNVIVADDYSHDKATPLPTTVAGVGVNLTVGATSVVVVESDGALYVDVLSLAPGATLNASVVVGRRAVGWATATVVGGADEECYLEDPSGASPPCTDDFSSGEVVFRGPLPLPAAHRCPGVISPASAVRNLTAEQTSPYEVRVAWTAPDFEGSAAISRYDVSAPAAASPQTSVGADVREVFLDVDANTTVAVSVRAYNDLYSPPATVVLTTSLAPVAISASSLDPVASTVVAGGALPIVARLLGARGEVAFNAGELARFSMVLVPNVAAPPPLALDSASGLLTATITPTTAGTLEVHLMYDGVEAFLSSTTVLPAAMVANMTTADSASLAADLVTLEERNITVRPEDPWGNSRLPTTACDSFLTTDHSFATAAVVADGPDGTCVVTVAAFVPGDFSVAIGVAGEDIQGSPFAFTAVESSAGTSTQQAATTGSVNSINTVEESSSEEDGSSANLIIGVAAATAAVCVVCVLGGVFRATKRKKAPRSWNESADEDVTVRAEANSSAVGEMVDELLHKKGTVPIGGGEFTTVYKCRTADKRWLCIKILKDSRANDLSARQEFHHEANALSRLAVLGHANIVALEFFSADKPVAVGIEFMPNGSLKSVLTEGPLSLARKTRILRDVASGLAAVHSMLIVHLDIKTANLLVDANGMVKVADFGISEVVNANGQLVESPGAGMACTPHYVAPERILSEYVPTLDLFKADVYSFSLVVYAVLGQVEPYAGMKGADVVAAIKESPTSRPQPDASWDATLVALMMECWSPNPPSRPSLQDVERLPVFANVPTLDAPESDATTAISMAPASLSSAAVDPAASSVQPSMRSMVSVSSVPPLE